ncbi:spermatogenesis- and oogenesis-specific basic helix-loop-helix-containing protein 1-like isoform X3 [Pteropus medius]|uniref:spermatogenesis- and oogenesis-specific basic helix-loop-helix-containing protein 1-like isoform X3 n=1 Tax=Pteropus vampyrus TaxID=132908 RepID=UPI00196AA1E1|nr:spermatogenesis- and oogenesis-specific basic helix-loop-helix-containing protein 1-like isoform X3 [Pteropus giganteus]
MNSDVSEGFRELKTWPHSAREEPSPGPPRKRRGLYPPLPPPSFLHLSFNKHPLSSSCLPSTGWPQGSLLAPSMSSCPPSGAGFCCKDPGGGSGLAKTPVMAESPGCCLPRNVLCERERRKRISASCEHLRALLPQFDGRREDMASVLEMSVQFLRLAGTLVPSREKHALWLKRQKDVLQLVPAGHTAADAPEPGTGASGVTMQQGPPSCVTLAVAEGLDRPASVPGPSGLVPRTPDCSLSKAPRLPAPWSTCSQHPPSSLVGEDAQSCLGQAGILTEGTDRAVTPDIRCVSACDVEDGTPFLRTASPDWWLGSLEGRGGSAPSRAPARSSPLARAEPGFLADPEPGSQGLPGAPLEPWGADVGCPSPALREDVDSIFPDFFAC